MKIIDMRKFLLYLKPHSKSIAVMFAATAVNQLCALVLPTLMSNLIDVGIRRNGISDINAAVDVSNQMNYILKTGFLMFLVTAVSAGLSVFVNYIMSKISAEVSASLRKDLFNKVMSFSYTQMNELSPASLITRVTGDIENVQMLILMSTQIIVPPLMMIGGIVMSVRKSAQMSPLIGLGALCAAVAVVLCFCLIIPKSHIAQKTEDEFNLVVNEQLSGAMVIRSFTNENFEQKRFKDSNGKFMKTALFLNLVTSFVSPILMVSMNIVTSVILWVGARQIKNMQMQVGDVVAFMQYAMVVIGAFLMLSLMISLIPKALVSVERVEEILCKKTNIKEDCSDLCENSKGNIKFKNVGFKYKGAQDYVLKNVDFCIKSGSTVGITGTTGSGKSTLVKLLTGLYDACEGEIFWGERDFKNIKKSDISKNISCVSQTDSLFSGTVASNLKMGNELCGENEMIEAAEIAHISKYIKENGINARVEQGGKNLSGGQKQRLFIARAIIKKADIYIFDNTFSALDFKTDMLIRESLFKYLAGATVIIVSQRIGTIKNCDKILVFDEGLLVGEGNHEELMKNCEVYGKTFELQLGKGECVHAKQ